MIMTRICKAVGMLWIETGIPKKTRANTAINYVIISRQK